MRTAILGGHAIMITASFSLPCLVATRPSKGGLRRGQPPKGVDVAASLDKLLEDDPVDYPLELSSLDPSDDSLLSFLWKYAETTERLMITMIRGRDIFERVAVISHSRHPQAYEQLYEQFRQWRISSDFEQMEAQRLEWERVARSKLVDELESRPNLLPRGMSVEEVKGWIDKIAPLLLVDVPIKATSKRKTPQYLRFVREDPFISHRFHDKSYPRFESYEVERDETQFDMEVGKIRVLSHPECRDLLIWVLGEKLRGVIIGQ